MRAQLTLNTRQFAEMRKELAKLDLTPQKRKRLLWRILKLGVMVAAKRHQRRQEDATGKKWPGRKDGRREKMMRLLPGMMAIRELPANESAKIYLRGSKKVSPGVVGQVQQTGMKTTVTADKAKRIKGNRGEEKATLRQAKRLHELGYMTHPVSAPGVASMSEIMRTLSRDKAGTIIRAMEGRPAKASWTIDLPAREWLAVSDEDFDKILVRQMRGIQFGAGVRAQDIKGKVK